jgi:hypothetical protein
LTITVIAVVVTIGGDGALEIVIVDDGVFVSVGVGGGDAIADTMGIIGVGISVIAELINSVLGKTR